MRYIYHQNSTSYPMGPGLMTPAVKLLIYTNIAVFLVTFLAPQNLRFWLFDIFALSPESIITDLFIWQPLTYLFLHGSIFHILFNMLVLWMFGVQLERLWGTRFFFRYYFAAGIGAALITIAVSLLPFSFSQATYIAPTIGASGAIYGLLLAFAVCYPEAPILLFLLFPIPAKYFVIILGSIAFLSAPRGDGVAHITHLGGLIAGYLFLKHLQGISTKRFLFGRLSVIGDIKYRYLKWRLGRLKKRFKVYSGDDDGDLSNRIH
jgi:membrane associated rhomboid family serine protease